MLITSANVTKETVETLRALERLSKTPEEKESAQFDVWFAELVLSQATSQAFSSK